jgi:hypothetical protein
MFHLIRLTPLKKGDGKRWVPKAFGMAGLPKEELLVGLLLISAPSGVIGVRKQVSDCTLRDFCFWVNVLNYPIISQPKLQIFRKILKQAIIMQIMWMQPGTVSRTLNLPANGFVTKAGKYGGCPCIYDAAGDKGR